MAYYLQHTAEEIDRKLNLIAENKNQLEYPYDGSLPVGLTDVGDGSVLTAERNGAYAESYFLLKTMQLTTGKKYIISLAITNILEELQEHAGFSVQVRYAGKEINTQFNDELKLSIGELDLSTETEKAVAISVYLCVPELFVPRPYICRTRVRNTPPQLQAQRRADRLRSRR